MRGPRKCLYRRAFPAGGGRVRTRLQQQSGVSEADLGLLWTPGPGIEIAKRVTMSVSEERVILIRIFCPQCFAEEI